MFSFLQVFQKFGHFALFVFLEVLCFFLIVNFNQSQRNIFVHSSSQLTGTLLEQTSKVDEYIYLKNENEKLIKENARLIREVLALSNQTSLANTGSKRDSSYQYKVVPMRIVHQSIRSTRNYLTLDKGTKDSILSPIGLVYENNVVGVIDQISENYSTALSLLNVDTRISASVSGQNYFGTVYWDGNQIDVLSMTGIPKHADLTQGDTIVTNGYSTLFPKDIMIGTIIDYKLDATGDFFEIRLKPSIDFGNISTIYGIIDFSSTERKNLEDEE